jgi:hypothetical protein
MVTGQAKTSGPTSQFAEAPLAQTPSAQPADPTAIAPVPPTSDVMPSDPDMVAAIIACLGAAPADPVRGPDGVKRPLADVLSTVCDIDRPAARAIEVLASRAPEVGESRSLQALAEGYPGAEPADADLLDLLYAFPSARPPVQELVAALSVRQSSCSSSGGCRKERRPTKASPTWVHYRVQSTLETGPATRDRSQPVTRLSLEARYSAGLWARLQQGAYVVVRAAAAKAPFARSPKAASTGTSASRR